MGALSVVGGWVTESAWTFMSRAGRSCLSGGREVRREGCWVAGWVSGGVAFFLNWFCNVFLIMFFEGFFEILGGSWGPFSSFWASFCHTFSMYVFALIFERFFHDFWKLFGVVFSCFLEYVRVWLNLQKCCFSLGKTRFFEVRALRFYDIFDSWST